MESQNAIRLGLANISGVGQKTITPVLEEREKNGPYQSMADFCSRAPRQGLSAKQIEALMKAGTIDDLTERGHAVEKAGLIWETINANSATRETGQMSMFGTTRGRRAKDSRTPLDDTRPETQARHSAAKGRMGDQNPGHSTVLDAGQHTQQKRSHVNRRTAQRREKMGCGRRFS